MFIYHTIYQYISKRLPIDLKPRTKMAFIMVTILGTAIASGAFVFQQQNHDARSSILGEKIENPDSTNTPQPSRSLVTSEPSPSSTAIRPSTSPSPTGGSSPSTTPQASTPPTDPSPTPAPPSETFNKKVLVLIYDPILENHEGEKLHEYKGWNNPDSVTSTFIASVQSVSGNGLNYQIVERIEKDEYPVKNDGFRYTDESYLTCVDSQGSTCHSPDLANYAEMINSVDACGKRNRGEIDELWIWGGPWFGYWESNLAGPGAYWYNSPPTTGTSCEKLLPIMGFNYERGEAEMFEDLAHRTESEMTRVYGSWGKNEDHVWNRFSLLDVDKPGRGGCGNAHLAVNAGSSSGYDRENSRTVSSSCDDFLNYPSLTETFKEIDCNAWGCSTLGYLKWWFSHLPRATGETDGKKNNWWSYIVNL